MAFGTELRRWRGLRHLSQLDLAGVAGVSQRHISFLETGRSRPSREMVVHLASAMDMPLRARNGLLDSAGFAPVYRERKLDHGELDGIRSVLATVLGAQEPHPAYIVDRRWNITMSNTAAGALIAAVAPAHFDAAAMNGNVLRLLLHPDGIRGAVANWDAAAHVLVARLRREVRESPDDDALRELLTETTEYVGSELTDDPPLPSSSELLVPIVLRTPLGLLRLFTTIATIGAAYDVTLEELRLEMLLPADEESRRMLREIVQMG